MITTVWRTTPDAAELAAIRALTEAVAAADGTTAYAEPTAMDLVTGGTGQATRHLLARVDGVETDDAVLVAYAHVDASHGSASRDDDVVEWAVHPDHRRRGIGARVADVLVAEFPGARAWAHGDHPGAARLAERHGWRRDRELWEMRRDPAAGPLPELVVPDGVEITPLRVGEKGVGENGVGEKGVGEDEQDVVTVNNRAFAWHPEQSGWTVETVRHLQAESWFDADGVLLARDASGDLLGFHWTKVHERSASVPEPLGEVYVLGVDPAAQGRHVGSALTLAGLHHLAGRGLDTVILYVEGDNTAAIATYRRLGFVRAAVDVSYRR